MSGGPVEIPTSFVVGFLLVVATIAGVIGWAAWTLGRDWRDDCETRWGRCGGGVVLWFGRIVATFAVVNLILAGLAIVVSVGPWGAEEEASANSVSAVYPDLPGGVRRTRGLDGEKDAAANRKLRSEFPEVPGSQAVSVSDRYIIDGEDRPYANGVMTEWTYRVDGATKCQIADTLERPLRDHGWMQQSLETAGTPPSAGNVRFTNLYRSAGSIEIVYSAPPTSFTIRIQSTRRYGKNGSKVPTPQIRQSSDCYPDLPPAPPAKPVNRASALKANQKIYAALPIPAGATVTVHSEDAATALGTGAGGGNVPIGYGTQWTLALPPATDRCASAAAFDTAMAKTGWERFTTHGPSGRESLYFKPPQSVQATWAGDGRVHLLVMNNGAIVGTRQHPNPSGFSAGATPESRGAPMPCIP